MLNTDEIKPSADDTVTAMKTDIPTSTFTHDIKFLLQGCITTSNLYAQEMKRLTGDSDGEIAEKHEREVKRHELIYLFEDLLDLKPDDLAETVYDLDLLKKFEAFVESGLKYINKEGTTSAYARSMDAKCENRPKEGAKHYKDNMLVMMSDSEGDCECDDKDNECAYSRSPYDESEEYLYGSDI